MHLPVAEAARHARDEGVAAIADPGRRQVVAELVGRAGQHDRAVDLDLHLDDAFGGGTVPRPAGEPVGLGRIEGAGGRFGYCYPALTAPVGRRWPIHVPLYTAGPFPRRNVANRS